MGQVGVLFPRTKHAVSGALPRTFLSKQMYSLGRLELLEADSLQYSRTWALCCYE